MFLLLSSIHLVALRNRHHHLCVWIKWTPDGIECHQSQVQEGPRGMASWAPGFEYVYPLARLMKAKITFKYYQLNNQILTGSYWSTVYNLTSLFQPYLIIHHSLREASPSQNG